MCNLLGDKILIHVAQSGKLCVQLLSREIKEKETYHRRNHYHYLTSFTSRAMLGSRMQRLVGTIIRDTMNDLSFFGDGNR